MEGIEPDRSLTERDIDTLVEAALGDETRSEAVIGVACEHVVFGRDAVLVKDALRWGFWFWRRQVELGRMDSGVFARRVRALFGRFCFGAIRELTEEDAKIARLVLANLYSEERDPLLAAVASA